MRRIATDGGPVYYASERFTSAGVPHAFSTRLGGVSPPPFDSLNLGNPSEGDARDDWDRIHENYRRLQSAIGCESLPRVWVHQVHGDGVAVVRRGEPFESGARADAIVSNDPSRVIAVRTADCVPILLSSRDGRVVAAVHAGWRGVVAGVARRAIERMVTLGARAQDVHVAIGPCIGPDAFEVGDEVAAAFAARFGDVGGVIRRRDDGRHTIDLRRALAADLADAGVAADRIDASDLCTHERRDEFFSHRRERGVTGRMAALIAAR